MTTPGLQARARTSPDTGHAGCAHSLEPHSLPTHHGCPPRLRTIPANAPVRTSSPTSNPVSGHRRTARQPWRPPRRMPSGRRCGVPRASRGPSGGPSRPRTCRTGSGDGVPTGGGWHDGSRPWGRHRWRQGRRRRGTRSQQAPGQARAGARGRPPLHGWAAAGRSALVSRAGVWSCRGGLSRLAWRDYSGVSDVSSSSSASSATAVAPLASSGYRLSMKAEDSSDRRRPSICSRCSRMRPISPSTAALSG